MRKITIGSALLALWIAPLVAQTVPSPTAPPPAAKPAAPPAAPPATRPAPAARPAARPAGTSTVTIQVTDAAGLPLGDVQVSAHGPMIRDASSGEDGSVRLANMRAGTYRFRFTREGSITLE